MKHAGSQEALRARIDPESAATSPRRRLLAAVRRQSSLSWLASFLCALFLVAVMADAPMRDLARSLDTSVVSILRVVTQFGNSAWPLGLSLLLFAALTIVSRTPNPFSPASLQNLRSALILVIGSVALSGAIASLTKNMIGRARPSTGATAHVFDFAIMSFRAGWAAFPSGHATTAAACAIALSIILPRLACAWLSIGLIAALSRSLLGVHWLTDCLAGIALGVLVSLAFRRWMERRQHEFGIEPSLVLKVLALATIVSLSSAYRVAKDAVGHARAYFRRMV